MASAELKEIRKVLTKESIREHQLSKVGGTETDMFVCGKCKGKNCSYTQVCFYNRPEIFKLAVIIKSALNLKLDAAVGYSPSESISTLKPYLKMKTGTDQVSEIQKAPLFCARSKFAQVFDLVSLKGSLQVGLNCIEAWNKQECTISLRRSRYAAQMNPWPPSCCAMSVETGGR